MMQFPYDLIDSINQYLDEVSILMFLVARSSRSKPSIAELREMSSRGLAGDERLLEWARGMGLPMDMETCYDMLRYGNGNAVEISTWDDSDDLIRYRREAVIGGNLDLIMQIDVFQFSDAEEAVKRHHHHLAKWFYKWDGDMTAEAIDQEDGEDDGPDSDETREAMYEIMLQSGLYEKRIREWVEANRRDISENREEDEQWQEVW